MNRAIQIDEHGPNAVKEALDQNEITVKQGYDITKKVQDLPAKDREQAAADLIQAQYNKAVEKLDEVSPGRRISPSCSAKPLRRPRFWRPRKIISGHGSNVPA